MQKNGYYGKTQDVRRKALNNLSADPPKLATMDWYSISVGVSHAGFISPWLDLTEPLRVLRIDKMHSDHRVY